MRLTRARKLKVFLVFAGFALLPALIFLVIGAVVATWCGSRTKAFGHALVVWFFFVLLYDLLMIGGTFLLKERTANQFIFLCLGIPWIWFAWEVCWHSANLPCLEPRAPRC